MARHTLHESMIFRLTNYTIDVLEKDYKPLLTALAMLNDEGECKLKVGDQKLELWQFRKRALENLFF
jgi:hypothetical protein